MNLVAIPAEMVERAEAQVVAARARRERYEAKVRRGRHDNNEKRVGGHRRALHYRDYPFIGWDGEAPTDTGYSLFGSSEGHEICHQNLSTEDCFSLLLEAKRQNPHSIFVWFGGRYDWDEITRHSIPLQKLARLKRSGSLWWHGYRITECEGKVYTVSKDGIRVTLYEISGWFHSSYIIALRKYGIRTDGCRHRRDHCSDGCKCICILCGIEAGKKERSEFKWSEIDDIAIYMRQELELMPELMDRIRSIVLRAGFDPRGWYGPSALARQALSRNKIFDCMSICPPEVNLAAQFAFAGGRFESFRGGILPRTYTRDKNSAYMHAALRLPNLANGEWRSSRNYERDKFAVYHIRYKDRNQYSPTKPYPLFRRLSNGNVVWPRRVDGWYWTPEAELVADDPGAEFVEAWIFDENDPSDKPFKFVQSIYERRVSLQELPSDNPDREAELALKWLLASIYGQLARTVGWDRRRKLPPKTHQLEWAGYILSHCRAEMWKIAMACGENLVSIDTDSVTSLAPIEVELGKALGQWKSEDADRMVFFQSGVYFSMATNGNWSKGKTRGMERRRGVPEVTPELLIQAVLTLSKIKLTPKRKYITTRMALNGQIEDHGKWKEHPGNTLVFGGGGKRYHNDLLCAERCNGDIHVFSPRPTVGTGSPFDFRSYPHLLPWKDGEKEIAPLFLDLLWVDTDRIDSDDLWLAELIV